MYHVFVIYTLKITQEKKLGNCYWREQSFCIRYVPAQTSSTDDVIRMSEMLTDGMEYIHVENNQVRGRSKGG